MCALAVPAAAQEASDGDARAQPGEVIVITPEQRAEGVDDLVGAEASHADRVRGLGDSAFVTVVRLAERAGETATVADVLARVVGVKVRQLGGLGGMATLSVRGAASGQTAVVVDGVPLSKLASAATDLGKLELGAFSELELYRGGVPVQIGGAALGGALSLSTAVGPAADGTRLTLSTGFGSFGARHLRARWRDGTEDGDFGYHLAAGYRGGDGDFPYFSDGGTPLSAGDDATLVRSNNGFDRFDGVARVRWRGDDVVIAGGARTAWQAQGVPGSAFDQSERASLSTFHQLADVSARVGDWLGVVGLEAQAGVYGSLERQRYRDLEGEIGLATQDLASWTQVVGLWGGAGLARGRHRVDAGLDARVDGYSEHSATGTELAVSDGRRYQLGLASSDEIALAGGRVAVRPAVRVDLVRTEPTSHRYDMDASTAAREDVFVSPRLSARWAVTADLAVKGNAGRYVRVPTLVEMFGDRGHVVGNPALEPETGWGADLGVVLAPQSALGWADRVYLETAVFWARPRDPIVFGPQSGLVVTARNLEGAELRGLELAGSVRLARTLTVTGHYTLLDSEHRSQSASLDGKRLPHRPAHQLYGRADLARELGERLVVVWGDLLAASGNFLDQNNVYELPPRLLFGAGLKVEVVRDLLVGLEVQNLADERVEDVALSPPPRPDLTSVPRALSDFYGYPLPGRAFYLSAEWAL